MATLDAAPDTTATDVAQEDDYPSPLYGWLVVSLLTVAYALSLLDRWVLTLLVAPIKAALNVSDTAMGLLMGPIFAVVYVLLGLPFGWMADRYNRRNIAAAGISMWCAMTVLSGTARNFTQLAFCRFGIGFGEAALTPAATSLIADCFPRKKVNAAIGVFNLGIYTGMGLSYLIGGALLAWATANAATFMGGGWDTWQIVFMAVGAPGFLVAALLLIVVREPKRRMLASQKRSASMKDCFAFIGRHRGAYVPLAVGMGTVALTGYAFTWLPTLFTRVWGWDAPKFSLLYGVILLVLGPAGTVLGGLVANRLYRRGMLDAPYRVISVGLPILVIVGGTAPLWPSPYMAATALAIAAFCSSMSTSAGVSSVIFATPAQYRGRVLALYTMTNSMIGTLLGPAGVGFLSDHFYTQEGGIRYALATILLVVGGGLTAYLLTGRKAYERAVAELEGDLKQAR
jgi:MFS family permease